MADPNLWMLGAAARMIYKPHTCSGCLHSVGGEALGHYIWIWLTLTRISKQKEREKSWATHKDKHVLHISCTFIVRDRLTELFILYFYCRCWMDQCFYSSNIISLSSGCTHEIFKTAQYFHSPLLSYLLNFSYITGNTTCRICHINYLIGTHFSSPLGLLNSQIPWKIEKLAVPLWPALA